MFFPKDKYRPVVWENRLLIVGMSGSVDDVYITNDASKITSITDDVDPPGPTPAGTLQGIFDQIYDFFFRRPVIYLKSDSEKISEAYNWGDHGIVGYLTDAPNNGQEYVRKNADWFVATGGGGTQYKITTMPQTSDENGSVAYSGFSTDLNALTSEAKWAVKKMYENDTEEWAGKTTFDEILDNYQSLTYS
jgi:hypothetical protein